MLLLPGPCMVGTWTNHRFGVDGKACLLRAVCEVAESPLRDDGLLGEVLNILLT